MNSLRTTTGYINAGGRGTRLAEVFSPVGEKGIAKAMLRVGEPSTTLVDHHIRRMGNQGYGSIVVAAGDQTSVYKYVHTHYANYPEVLAVKQAGYNGSAGDLLRALAHRPEQFLSTIAIQNVDTILAVSDERFVGQHRANARKATICLTRNQGVPNEGAFYVSGTSAVLFSQETSEGVPTAATEAGTVWRGSSTGAVVLDKEYLMGLEIEDRGEPVSLYKDIIKGLVETDQLQAYDNGFNYFQDLGTKLSWQTQVLTGAVQPYLHYTDTSAEVIEAVS